MKKTILLLFLGALIPVGLTGLYILYIRLSLPVDIWSPENRSMIKEIPSPDNRFKIGIYHYDEGALGYTAPQVSIAQRDDEYPIAGNVLGDQAVKSIQWVSNTEVIIYLPNSNNWESKIVLQLNE